MSSPQKITVSMRSSTSDVWAAVISATGVYPLAMPDMYDTIRVGRRDGYTVGSTRQITFGPDYRNVVRDGEEEITDIDVGSLRVRTTMNRNGGFVPLLFDSFDAVLTVIPSSGNMSDPCDVEYEFFFVNPARSQVSTDFLKEKMTRAFRCLDYYLRIGRGVRGLTRP